MIRMSLGLWKLERNIKMILMEVILYIHNSINIVNPYPQLNYLISIIWFLKNNALYRPRNAPTLVTNPNTFLVLI